MMMMRRELFNDELSEWISPFWSILTDVGHLNGRVISHQLRTPASGGFEHGGCIKRFRLMEPVKADRTKRINGMDTLQTEQDEQDG